MLAVPGSVQVIGVAGRPAPIPDEEIDNVRLFVECLAQTGVVPKQSPRIERGQEVVIESGPFAGVRGVVLERRGADRVLIHVGIEAIGQALKVEVAADRIEISRDSKKRHGQA